MIATLTVVLLLLGTSLGLTEENQSGDLEQRGLALAERMCSQCHDVFDSASMRLHVFDCEVFFALAGK